MFVPIILILEPQIPDDGEDHGSLQKVVVTHQNYQFIENEGAVSWQIDEVQNRQIEAIHVPDYK